MQPGIVWNSSRDKQEEFYRLFLKEIVRREKDDGIELFTDFKRFRNYQLPPGNRIGLRGRTLTNALVKIGLINSEHNLSQVGFNYLEN